jgi:2-methylisoborneol synthase
MSMLTRASAPPAAHPVAGVVRTLLSSIDAAAPADILAAGAVEAPDPVESAAPLLKRLLAGPTGLGTSGTRMARGDGSGVPPLYCPPAVRDNPALGEEVNERLVAWAEEVGIYPGNLDKVRTANFGRLIMLAHPDSDDPDRLLAAAKCALAEWAVDDHYVDGEAAVSEPDQLGRTLAVAYTAIDPAHLPARYQPRLAAVARDDPVMVALRSSLDNLGHYGTPAQVARLRHELSVMFVAYNQEAVWRTKQAKPAVWEYLVHRHLNSFLPPMALIDVVGGYELPAPEFADPRVRRVFSLAGTASVIVNDLYSMAKEDPTDTNLPRVIAAEDRCGIREAVQRTAELHDELVHSFEDEAAALVLTGSPALARFLAGLWAWLGGSREWHATTGRYQAT